MQGPGEKIRTWGMQLTGPNFTWIYFINFQAKNRDFSFNDMLCFQAIQSLPFFHAVSQFMKNRGNYLNLCTCRQVLFDSSRKQKRENSLETRHRQGSIKEIAQFVSFYGKCNLELARSLYYRISEIGIKLLSDSARLELIKFLEKIP